MYIRNFSSFFLIDQQHLLIPILLKISSLFKCFVHGILGRRRKNHISVVSSIDGIVQQSLLYCRLDIYSVSEFFSLLLMACCLVSERYLFCYSCVSPSFHVTFSIVFFILFYPKLSVRDIKCGTMNRCKTLFLFVVCFHYATPKLGRLGNGRNAARCHKGQETVEIHYCPRSEGTRYIEKGYT